MSSLPSRNPSSGSPEDGAGALQGSGARGEFARFSAQPHKKNQHFHQKSRNVLSVGTPRLSFVGFPPSKFLLNLPEANPQPCPSPGQQRPRSPQANFSALSPCAARRPAIQNKPNTANSWASSPQIRTSSFPKPPPPPRIVKPCGAEDRIKRFLNLTLEARGFCGGLVVVCLFFLVFPEAAYFVQERTKHLTSEIISCLCSV